MPYISSSAKSVCIRPLYMFDNDLPCFRLEYDAPEVDGIREKYFGSWEKVFDGSQKRIHAYSDTNRLLIKDRFSQKEREKIYESLGYPLEAEREDVERAVKCTEGILMERYAKRIKATPEELKEKYLKMGMPEGKTKVKEDMGR